MEVHHKPKPWHGFREFLKEYGIIVLGVLTALAAEQVAEQAHWAERLRETRGQLHAELSADVTSAVGWLAAGPCIDRQLDALGAAVLAARKSGTLVPPTTPYSPMLTVFRSDAWLNARSLQVSDHFSAEEMRRLSQTYFFISEFKDDIVQLHQEAAALLPLRQPLDRMTPEEADGFSSRVGEARELQSRMHLAAIILVGSAGQVSVQADAAAMQKRVQPLRERYGSCVSDPALVMDAIAHGKGEADTFRRLNLSPPVLTN